MRSISTSKIAMSELEEYKSQLKDATEALSLDPENASLKELHKELTDLVQLLSESAQEPQDEEPQHSIEPQPQLTVSTPSATKFPFSNGDIIFAKQKLDNSFKEAKITSISGNSKTITIEFIDSKSIETVPIDQVHHTKPKIDQATKYKLKQQKKEKDESKPSKNEVYEKELNQNVQSWKNFSKKKGIKKSQFKTSDKVDSKVGVASSGGAMTSKKKEQKLHRYTPY